MALKQIMRELKDLQKDPDNSFKAGPVAEDMFRWKATIMGPPDSPYAGGAFPVSIYFSSEYPLKPRRIAFRTKVFHPKIGSNGNICMDILMEKWCPTLTISKLLLSICSLVPKIAVLYKEFRNKYDKTAKSGTQKYAMG